MELVVLAAGMGSRFGGLKQIAPVGPNGEFIIDYSIYDAIKSGFDKIVFVIKKENYDIFKETIGKRIENKVEVEYVFQDNDDNPANIKIPKERTKPLGTGHAIYVTRNAVEGPFGVISADDFYGRNAFEVLATSLKNTDDYSIVGYQISTTLSENGKTKRGICYENNNQLEKIIESEVEKIGDKVHCVALETGEEFDVSLNRKVFMLMFGLRMDVFDFIEKDFKEFLNNKDNLISKEYYIPTVLDKMLQQGKKIIVLPTSAVWKGITYAEDLEELKKYIKEEIKNGVYPEKLWK